MILAKTNVVEKLVKERAKRTGADMVMKEVHQILRDVSKNHDRIETTISGVDKTQTNAFNLELLVADHIFHIDEIRSVCIDYRLRFLDSRYFKGDIPREAISKITQLEKLHSTEIKGFKIVAPSKLFKLKNLDDPLLFAPIGNDYFYLIHKWGKDLHPFRKLLMWPFRNIVNLTCLVLVVSYLVAAMVPNGLFSKHNSTAEFWIIYFFMFKSIAAVVIFYGFALGKNFSPAIWNSKYFNA
ncbi:MAG: hypothetical protein MUO53_10805 [Maribacter sp.]|nr:hypothetical protein [Maribacter sp.]